MNNQGKKTPLTVTSPTQTLANGFCDIFNFEALFILFFNNEGGIFKKFIYMQRFTKNHCVTLLDDLFYKKTLTENKYVKKHTIFITF